MYVNCMTTNIRIILIVFFLSICMYWTKGEIPKEIGDLTQLITLNLQHNFLLGNILSTLMFNNSSLQIMVLNSNNLTGILPSNVCQRLPNLRLLYLYANDISGKMPNVWRYCKELEDLELSFNNFDKGRMPVDIGKLTKLQFLYLANNNLEGKIFLLIYSVFIYLFCFLTKYNVFIYYFFKVTNQKTRKRFEPICVILFFKYPINKIIYK